MRIAVLICITMSLFTFGGAPAADCTPTRSMSSGTHFKPITQQKIDIGQGFKVQGRVLSATDCTPIAGARVAHWQAGENGHYQDRLRAYLLSDDTGRYAFETEWPATMVPHLHFRVSAAGYKEISTQWIGDDRVANITFDIVLQPE